ncbi:MULTISPECIES: endonuclease/exonuclease/phosphatase family protein [unclassified Alistipes]|uniref:endonuclease/exonuclease/phosphatase family protein n=1 Tax=unclassified Alistipes TaxID=2608932 RepID=UPI0007A84268|nr:MULTISPECIES: endonuclease/exonuclease/phosphatase family protein [unclassified Alistipes]CVI66273.1 Endonuclease/Exonuclease/phosphatase family protein [Alistipes sp. CHKCI003]HJC76479.1 endonuclease/exonuclease/phosphatase family protein [Candidatus Alistipes excrementavium]
MKKLLFSGFFVLLLLAGFAQKPYKVMFYNFENLFDTINDPEILDEEFTPDGPKKWNSVKYNKKIGNLERVLFDIAALDKNYPAVIGVSEVENRSVLEDVIATPKLAPANYRIVHYDSPDARGVDVAFFYRPDVFELEGSAPIPFTMEGLPNFKTRDIVTMWGTIEGEPFYFMVAHWPSRLGGKEASAPKRERAAEIMRRAADSVLRLDPATKVVMMGDFNDDATDDSITEVLGAKGDIRKLEPGDYYNPFINVLKAGYGTLAYQDAWNLFDNIVVSENLVAGDGLKIRKASPKARFYGNIFSRPYMIQQEGQYKGYPLRTFVGNNFQGGYSDHFPVYIYIGK